MEDKRKFKRSTEVHGRTLTVESYYDEWPAMCDHVNCSTPQPSAVGVLIYIYEFMNDVALRKSKSGLKLLVQKHIPVELHNPSALHKRLVINLENLERQDAHQFFN